MYKKDAGQEVHARNLNLPTLCLSVIGRLQTRHGVGATAGPSRPVGVSGRFEGVFFFSVLMELG